MLTSVYLHRGNRRDGQWPAAAQFTSVPMAAAPIHRKKRLAWRMQAFFANRSQRLSPSTIVARAAMFPIFPHMAIQIRTSLAEPETGVSFIPHRPSRPEKAEGGKRFELVTDYTASGDQPAAIRELTAAARAGDKDQVLLG
ncbi:hypothetical protein LTR94_033047, partial [Friedmanniomyces endolithicus]